MHKYDYLRVQADQAKVYIRNIKGAYNIIVVNEETRELITALKELDIKAIINCGKNHGWTI